LEALASGMEKESTGGVEWRSAARPLMPTEMGVFEMPTDVLDMANEGALGIFAGTYSVVALIVAILVIASMWKLFSKAGQPGWAAIVPLYNYYVLLKVVGRPGWWLILLFIPLVNLIVALIVTYDLAKAFGKGMGYFLGLLFLGFIFYPMLAFGDAKYQGAGA